MSKALDLTGQKFGRLTAIKKVGVSKDKNVIWECVCECGNTKEVRGSHLFHGKVRSCGCLAKEILDYRNKYKNSNLTHGLSKTRLYTKYVHMKERCSDKGKIDYYGRGIKVSDEWSDKENGFINFYNWAINNGYKDGLTIDRKDVNGDYEPDNCRWITNQEQQNNKRSNVFIEYNGQINTIANWSRIMNLPFYIIQQRYHRGDRGDCLFRPIKSKKIS